MLTVPSTIPAREKKGLHLGMLKFNTVHRIVIYVDVIALFPSYNYFMSLVFPIIKGNCRD